MTRHDALQQVLDSGIVAIIRSDSSDQLVDVAQALYDGGIRVMEVTFTVPNVLEIISTVQKRLGRKILLGAGTVLDPESARAALLAGAEFIVSPILNEDVIRICHRYDRIVMPGVFTPTEVVQAWDAGADVVKIFPADVGGPDYLKALRGPLPQVRMLPTGGVNLKTLPEFFKAGACAVGLGGSLVEKEAVRSGNLDRIRTLAAQYVELVETTRNSMADSSGK